MEKPKTLEILLLVSQRITIPTPQILKGTSYVNVALSKRDYTSQNNQLLLINEDVIITAQ